MVPARAPLRQQRRLEVDESRKRDAQTGGRRRGPSRARRMLAFESAAYPRWIGNQKIRTFAASLLLRVVCASGLGRKCRRATSKCRS
jgi:hypothetical protein